MVFFKPVDGDIVQDVAGVWDLLLEIARKRPDDEEAQFRARAATKSCPLKNLAAEAQNEARSENPSPTRSYRPQSRLICPSRSSRSSSREPPASSTLAATMPSSPSRLPAGISGPAENITYTRTPPSPEWVASTASPSP